MNFLEYYHILDRCQPIKNCIVQLAITVLLFVTLIVHIDLYYMFKLDCLKICVHPIQKETPDLNCFDKLNWSEEGVDELLCDSNYINMENQILVGNEDLNVIQLNIRGLNSKITELTHLIDHSLKGSPPDITALCETWLTKESPTPNIPGYDFVHKCRLHKCGGGVALLISNSIRYKTLPDLKYENDTIESCFAEIKLNTRHIIVGSCYRLPNTDCKEFVKLHRQLLSKVTHSRRSVMVVMNHNLDPLKTNTHHNTQDFLECNLQMGLYPAIIYPTRITKSSATLIDNIFVSSDLQSMCKSWILIDSTSDHLPCVLTVSGVKHKLKDPIRIESHDLSERDRLKTSLRSHDWNYIKDTLIDTNDACDRFFKDLTEQIKHFVPITSKTIPYAKLRREAWLTNGILKAFKKKKDYIAK